MGGRRDWRKEGRKGRERGRGDLLQGLGGIDAPAECRVFSDSSKVL